MRVIAELLSNRSFYLSGKATAAGSSIAPRAMRRGPIAPPASLVTQE